MSNENQSGDRQGNAGGAGKGNNRRRFFRRRKSGDKAPEGSPAQEPRKGNAEKPAAARKSPDQRKPQEPAKGRTRNQAKLGNPNRDDANNKGDRSGRGRRRRRRSVRERIDEPTTIPGSTLAMIDQEYVPPQSVFVYTYVLRPGHLSSHEFRPEHFSRVGRRLEDFDIDLSVLFPPEGEAKPKPVPTRAAEEPETDELADDYDPEFDDEFPDELADEPESQS